MNIRCILLTRFWEILFDETLGRVFVLKHVADLFKDLGKLLKLKERIKSSAESLRRLAECLKSSVACLCYDSAHADPINRGSQFIFYNRDMEWIQEM